MGQCEPQKLLEGEPVVDLILRLLVRQIEISLENQDLEHQYPVMTGTASGTTGLLLEGTLERGPKHLPFNSSIESSQRG